MKPDRSDFGAARAHSSGAVSVYTWLGLSLLYESAYFLPPLVGMGPYFLPSTRLGALVVLPALGATAVVAALIYGLALGARRSLPPAVVAAGAFLGLSAFVPIGLKGILFAFGYDWRALVPTSWNSVISLRGLRYLLFASMPLLLWPMRRRLIALNRLLGSLGFALALLAVVRVAMIWTAQASAFPAAAPRAAAAASAGGASHLAAGDQHSRRVIWVIFDEMDFDRTFGEGGAPKEELPNLHRLAAVGLFAERANSPASATLYSIPALLIGEPMADPGVRIDRAGALRVKLPGGRWLPFDQAHSVFGRLGAKGFESSALGFYHPYCKIFGLESCESLAWPEIGNPASALLANSPESLYAGLVHNDYWDTITRTSLERLPDYLRRDDALTFVHLNIPHLPATYADQWLHQAAGADFGVEYDHNLKLTDRVVGQIVQEVAADAGRHQLLLIVSTDHWLRNSSIQSSAQEVSRRIPFIVWKVGESTGKVLHEPVSTVHTADMIAAYLDGTLTTQSDIAQWWGDQAFHPTYVAP